MAEKAEFSDILYLIAYGLSKFAGMTKGRNEFSDCLGYTSRTKFLNRLVELGLVSSSPAMSNRQDGFDAIFENAKAGWKDAGKVKKYSNLRARIDTVLGNYSIEEYAEFVNLLITFCTTPENIAGADAERISDIVYEIFGYRVSVKTPDTFQDNLDIGLADTCSLNDIDDDGDLHEDRLHTEAQWLLIQLGKMTGCQVFIAKNDSKSTYHQAPISDGCLSELPRIGLEDKTYRRASLIDIVWIYKGKIVCAFEVEVSTSIYSGILRMSDLAYSMPYNAIEGYIVAPENRINKVIQQLQRPTFSNDTINNCIKYMSIEEIRELFHLIEGMNAPQGAIKWEIIHKCSHPATEG